MLTGINGDMRSKAAEKALIVHDISKNRRPSGEPAPAMVTDLLADLMHYCDREGVDFDSSLSVATDHYDHEKGESAEKPA